MAKPFGVGALMAAVKELPARALSIFGIDQVRGDTDGADYEKFDNVVKYFQQTFHPIRAVSYRNTPG